MRMLVLGAVVAAAAAALPDVVEACATPPERLELALEGVVVDGAVLDDSSAYDGFEVHIESFGGGTLFWYAQHGAEGFHASYDASR